MHIDDCNGIPLIWEDDVPGPMTASLFFRTGVVDETLYTRGINHLVEHLTLGAIGDVPYSHNGFVELLRTGFVVRGDSEDVVRFFRSVSEALGKLPTERVLRERDVLRAEAASRIGSPIETFAALRYGTRGPGLLEYMEFGLNHLGATPLQKWADERFCRANAVMWMTAPPPEDLSVDLPEGKLFPADHLADEIVDTPVWSPTRSDGVGVSFVCERSTKATLLTAYLDEKMRAALRTSDGVSYAPAAVYLPISSEKAQLVLWADCLPAHHERAWRSITRVLEQTRETVGPSDLKRIRELMARSWSDPQSLAARLDGAATQQLQYQEITDWLSEVAEVEPADLGALLDEVSTTAIHMAPEDVIGTDKPSIPKASTRPPVKGKKLKPSVKAKAKEGEARRVVLGREGVTYFLQGEEHLTLLFEECEADLYWPDGYRMLIGGDGLWLSFHPSGWRGGDDVATELHRRLAPVRIAMTGKSPLQEEQEAMAAKASVPRPVLVLSFLAIWGVALFIFGTEDYQKIRGVLTALLFGSIAAWRYMEYRREHGG